MIFRSWLSAVLLSAIAVFGSAALAQAPATRPAGTAAYPLWDGKESVAEHAKRAGIKDVEISLSLGPNVALKLTLIPTGKFMMGSPETEKGRAADESPQHEVTISRPFYMGVCEVTRVQYWQIRGKTQGNSIDDPNDRERAASYVSWSEAGDFCKRVSAKTGWHVGLPTEAQWEFACRAGTITAYSFGDQAGPSEANEYSGPKWSDVRGPGLVALRKPNTWGLYDMHGNVLEWCRDFYDPNYYQGGVATDPCGPGSGEKYAVRGIGRSARRAFKDSLHHYPPYGFRVIAEMPDGKADARPAPAATAPAVRASDGK